MRRSCGARRFARRAVEKARETIQGSVPAADLHHTADQGAYHVAQERIGFDLQTQHAAGASDTRGAPPAAQPSSR